MMDLKSLSEMGKHYNLVYNDFFFVLISQVIFGLALLNSSNTDLRGFGK